MPDTATPTEPAPPAAKRYGGAALNRYSRLTPLFWHGMRVGEWSRLLREHGCRVSGRGWLSIFSVSAMSVVNSACSAYDGLKYGRRIKRVELPAPPLFVLGHWRSGTTMLHEMLIRDPEHTCPNTYQCYTPHHFNMSERWVTPFTGWMLPKRRPMDNVATGWKRP
ncbi:MAG: sulfotransferase, partial [Planctomycetota bacterium]